MYVLLFNFTVQWEMCGRFSVMTHCTNRGQQGSRCVFFFLFKRLLIYSSIILVKHFKGRKAIFCCINIFPRIQSYLPRNKNQKCMCVCFRAIMTHASVPEKEREVLGISDTLIRLSVGLENEEDIIKDLDQALNAAVSTGHPP